MIFVTMRKLIYSFTTRGNGRGHTFSAILECIANTNISAMKSDLAIP